MYKSFKDMVVWQKAMTVAEIVFEMTEKLPKKEDYGLTSQIRRAALSISANIAEGYGRNHILDKINFYYYARGSAMETKNHLEYGKRVGYFDNDYVEKVDLLLEEILFEINKLILSLKNKKSSPKS